MQDPVPRSKENNMSAQAFWDRQAIKYAKKPIADLTAYEEKLQRIRSVLRPTDRILEIGCGTGGTARKIATGVAHVTATDLSAEMIRIARSRSDEFTAKKIEILQAEASQEVSGYPFDAICAFSLLHLVDDIPNVLDAVYRQVKPGGLFLSKTVCLKDSSRWIQVIVRMLVSLRIAPKVVCISRAELIRHLSSAGFEIDQTVYFDKKRMRPFIIARRPAD